MDREKQPGPSKNAPASQDELSRNSDVEEFFRKLKSDMRRPKPAEDSIAAALQAIQRLAHEVDPRQLAEDAVAPSPANMGAACSACGCQNREDNAFCGKCGAPLSQTTGDAATQLASVPGASAPVAGQHHYHHHYHHHYFPAAADADSSAATAGPRSAAGTPKETAPARAPLTGPSLSRAEASLRKLTQQWALACNTKQLEDLLDFYSPDALVLRSNFPPVRSAAAIREFFCAALDAGLGEVEMEPLRVEMFGDMAYEAGRCKLLVPVAVGKRREERGKYLIIFSRQGSGEWKAVADCWSSDLSLQAGAEPEAAKAASTLSPTGLLSRTPRKSA